ncbi:beta-ketoacyl synthase N-terminal-like domain-containing protein [Streptomyces sp. NRRL S-37]|uniref:beta-ketoacyl synthase N-terminal-like domain-containing protein n=1 Tax=Streptomyces sp. NRRL S-37 TaxID=1463903 RepID=UPI00068CB0D3|nr:beta-ketoacyl synthase N-terminal-like domain-containing protein [Streptomyces sp. NRRL S-37]
MRAAESTVRTDVLISGLGTALAGVPGPDALLDPPGDGPATDPVDALRGPGLRYKDRATKLALCAARDALADAGLLGPDGDLTVDGDDFGVVVSSNWGNVDTVCDASATIRRGTYKATSPMLLPNTASNVTASWVAITHGLRGANVTLCNGPTSGLDAVHWAHTLVAVRRLRRVLVIGVEPANEPVRHLVGDAGPVFDGAVAFVAEAADAVRTRGGTPLARIGRYARAGDLPRALAGARDGESAPPDAWWLPERPLSPAVPDTTRPAGVPAHDLSARYGRCSGALGVLQCVAATAALARASGSSMLAAAGQGLRDGGPGEDDAAAALVLHRVPGPSGGAAS